MPTTPRLRNPTLRLFIFWGSLFEDPMESMDFFLPGEARISPKFVSQWARSCGWALSEAILFPKPSHFLESEHTREWVIPDISPLIGLVWTRTHPACYLCPASP